MAAAVTLIALECDEALIKTMFLILIFTTLGSFRVISNGAKARKPLSCAFQQ
jgi:hypothetical protein